jgi:hypothetical protein
VDLKSLRRDNFIIYVFLMVVKLRYFLTVLISVIFIICYVVVPGSIGVYCVITVLLGLGIGGMFHLYVAFNMMLYGDQKPRNVDMVSNFCIAVGCICLGLFQLVIGLVTDHEKKDKSSSY